MEKYLLVSVITILFYCINYVLSETILFEDDSTVSFSGSNYGSSTGWVYSQSIDNAIQWGRLRYIMDPITASGGKYVHITFMAINNGLGTYEYTWGSTTANVSQQLRIVDSVGSTSKMQSTPYASMHYILNIDTPSDGELDVETDYIYYYDTVNWTCMEWYTNYNNQEIKLYENSELVYDVNANDGDLTFTGSTGATISYKFKKTIDVRIGMYTYNGISVSGSFKDVKISDTRIGCNDNTYTNTNAATDDGDDDTGGNGNTYTTTNARTDDGDGDTGGNGNTYTSTHAGDTGGNGNTYTSTNAATDDGDVDTGGNSSNANKIAAFWPLFILILINGMIN